MLNTVSTSAILAMPQDAAGFDQVTVTNGSGSCSGVYVTVQKGTSADVNIDFTIKTLSESTFNQFKSHLATTDYSHYTNDASARYGSAGSWFASLFGGVYNAGGSISNTTSTFHAATDDQSGFNSLVHKLDTSDFHITGKLTAVGTSFIPVTVSAYVKVTKIKFSDGTELHVIDTDTATAATQSGDTTGVQTQASKLTVTSL